MKPNKPSNKYFFRALLRKVDTANKPKKVNPKFEAKRMLKMPNPKGGVDIFVSPAMYRHLHLGKVSNKNGSRTNKQVV